MKVAIYARYSSDLQNPRSVDDQIAVCKEYAIKHELQVVRVFSDSGISGASLNRPGVKELIDCDEYDAVLCEALDRLSRDNADMATLHKHLSYSDKTIITLDDGQVNDMTVGFKGMMNQMFLTQLAEKTHRGLKGKVSQGLSAGGICYGYDIDNELINGQIIKGKRKINQEQAEIVRHIFIEYAINDKSPRTIAKELNAKGAPFINGKQWNDTTIIGNRRRGTGMLNNEIYIGVMVWNKLKYKKNPITGKRRSFYRPEHEHIRQDMPELRIIDGDLWQAVKDKQRKLDAKISSPKKRATYIMSNLIKCDCCDGGVAMRNSVQYGCSRAKTKGTCDSSASVRRDLLESAVLRIISNELLQEDVIQAFVSEYNQHMKRLIDDSQKSTGNVKAKVYKLEQEKNNLIESIKKGIPVELIRDELSGISNQIELLKRQADIKPLPFMKHSGIRNRFIEHVNTLNADSLDHDAKVHIRKLIHKAILKQNNDVDLYIDLSGLIGKKIPASKGEYLPLVAGAGFEPTTFGL